MSISEPFIRRPVATTLLTLGVLLGGLLGYRALPVSTLPQVDFPTIVVSTSLPGASADTMASAVTTPLERQLGQVPSLAQMTSASGFGWSQITLQFALERSIDAAEQDVQAAINAASTFLPTSLPAPPVYSKSNPADAPILTLAVTSPTLPLPQVSDLADSILAQRIAQAPGVGLVSLSGSQKPAVRVMVDPQALAGAALGLEDVRAALSAANVNQPKGSIDGPRQDFTLATNDQLVGADAYRPLVVAFRGGAPVRLGDLGRVEDGVENALLAGWADGRRGILVSVQRQPGANVIGTADRVKALLPQLLHNLPGAAAVAILNDRTETVRASIRDVQETLVLTVLLVVAVIFVFLRSLRATVIPGVAVPLSLIATFGLMALLGYSLDNLSLMALTISTGFVVDDAIVMIENISRHIEEGQEPFPAALAGARQIGFTIVSLTVSLVAVLIPLLFMGGIIGRLFREFAVTLSLAIGVSALLSLTLTAMMCGHLLRGAPRGPAPPEGLRPKRRGLQARVAGGLERSWEAARGGYDRSLGWVLDHQGLMLLVTAAAIGLTGLLAVVVPKGFFPEQDTGTLLGTAVAPPSSSFAHMAGLQQALDAVVRADPDVAHVASFVGADGSNLSPSTGRMVVTLRPREAGRAASAAIVERLRPRLREVAGVRLTLGPAQDLVVDARASQARYQYTLEDADPDELDRAATRLAERLRGLPELGAVESDQAPGGQAIELRVDRDSASRLGVAAATVDETLYDAFGQRFVSTIFTQLNQYRVILEVAAGFREGPEALDRLFVRSAAGSQVPLGAIASVRPRQAPLVIHHQGQFPSVTLAFDPAPGGSLGAAVEAVGRAAAGLGLPPGVRHGFSGTAQAFRESLASEPALVLAALVTVYIVLGVLYESFVHPVTILSTLPSAGVGALLALLVCGMDFGIIALIGVVLLIGIVKKNAIMMIDFALDAEREQGLAPRAAIHQACLLRFRPIMMTTMAALLGAVPLALGRGTGSELRRPLGVTIIGGLLISQLITLYTTPVIYLALGRLVGRLRGRHPGAPTDPERQGG